MPSRSDPEYRRARRLVLAGSPECVWCGAPATTVDHVVEMDRFADPREAHAMTNLVPACRPCNSSRGAVYGNRKRSAVRQAREEAARRSESLSEAPRRSSTSTPRRGSLRCEDGHPEPLASSLSPDRPKRSRTSRSTSSPADPGGTVRIPPRLLSPSWGDPSHGPEVAAWSARHLGVELRDWQRLVVDGMLQHDRDGILRHRWSLVSCARQNGKTTVIAALIGWWLTDHARRSGPQTVLSVAHRLDLAEELWHVLVPVFDAGTFGECRSWATHGRKELRLPDGRRWRISSATPAAGHGTSNDLLVVDELWSVDSDVLQAGLLPTQRARTSPLCAMFSTAGTESSRALLQWRETGIESITSGRPGRLHFCEWSPPPGCDPTDPAIWPMANPSWNHGQVNEAGLRDELGSPNRDAFLRSSLNLWTAAESAWIPPGLWDELQVDDLEVRPTVLAVESSRDGTRFVGVLAGETPDGIVEVDTAFVVFSETEMWARVRELAVPGVLLAQGGSLTIHLPPELAPPRSREVGHAEILEWTGLVRGLILERRLRHRGEVAMSEHVNRAVPYTTRSGMGISVDHSPGPVELTRALIWAVALASRPRRTIRPAIGGARPGARR